MTDRIVVRGIRAQGRHGLRDTGERNEPQPFVVDVELHMALAGAAASDTLGATVDYRDIARQARTVVEEGSFELVETLAGAIADAVLRLGGASVHVSVSKPAAAEAMDVDTVTVEVVREA